MNWDHPLLFALAITMVVLGASSLITWGAKAAGLHGLASLAQHP
jgi:hypothetical protein